MLSTKFRVNWPSGSGEEVKNIFSRWQPWQLLAIFDLQGTLILSTKFQVHLSFGSGEEANDRFSRWLPLLPSWITDRNNFSYF